MAGKYAPDIDEIMEVLQSDVDIGWCRECHAERECTEKDAMNLRCNECGKERVFGSMHWWHEVCAQ